MYLRFEQNGEVLRRLNNFWNFFTLLEDEAQCVYCETKLQVELRWL